MTPSLAPTGPVSPTGESDHVLAAIEPGAVTWTRFRRGYRVRIAIGTTLFLVFCLYGLVALLGRHFWGWRGDDVRHWAWLPYVCMLGSTLFNASVVVPGGGRRRLEVAAGDDVLVLEPDGVRVPSAVGLVLPWEGTRVRIVGAARRSAGRGSLILRHRADELTIPLTLLAPPAPELHRMLAVRATDPSLSVPQPAAARPASD